MTQTQEELLSILASTPEKLAQKYTLEQLQSMQDTLKGNIKLAYDTYVRPAMTATNLLYQAENAAKREKYKNKELSLSLSLSPNLSTKPEQKSKLPKLDGVDISKLKSALAQLEREMRGEGWE